MNSHAAVADEQWSFWIHLPGCLLGELRERAWAGGHLCALDHDSWHALDQTVFQPVDYADCRPVFYRGAMRGGRSSFGPDDAVFTTVTALKAQLHRALALVSKWPLPPNPELSCCYLISEHEERCQVFMVGPCGRDWILTGHFRQPRQLLDDALLDQAERSFHHLKALHTSLSGSHLESALQTLAFVSLPDAYVGDGGPARWHLVFLNAVTALEQLLLSDGNVGQAAVDSITTTFGRHVAVMLAGDFAKMGGIAQQARTVYKLRCDLMHGRRGLNLQDETQAGSLALGLAMLQLVLRNALALATRHGINTNLPTLLAAAAGDPVCFAALQTAFEGDDA